MAELGGFLEKLVAGERGELDCSFTLDESSAIEKLGNRSTDPAFPYLKFAQGLVVCGAAKLTIKVSNDSVTLTGHSHRPFPSLERICGGLPEEEFALEAFRSCALAVRALADSQGYWSLEQSGERETLQLEGGQYRSTSTHPKVRRAKTDMTNNRLVLFHKWRPAGKFFARMKKLLKRRFWIWVGLMEALVLYPLPIERAGYCSVQDARLERYVRTYRTFGRLGNRLFSYVPSIIVYCAADPDDENRFLTEPLNYRYDLVVERRRGAPPEAIGRSELKMLGKVSLLMLETNGYGEPVELTRRNAHLAFGSGREKIDVKMFPFPGELMITWGVAEINHGVTGGIPCYCQEGFSIPQRAEGTGWVCIVDRGVALEPVEADLGVEGAVAVVGVGALNLDLASRVVKDGRWQELLEYLRARLSEVLRSSLPYLEPSAPGLQFIREQMAGDTHH